MLISLNINNYALISKLHIDFDRGFSVLTGETGAGKSIIIGAIGLISGQRADTKAVKEGEKKSVVEVAFDIKAYNLKPFFEEKELDYDQTTTIRREITANGKSRAFVNDTPVSLATLKELSDRLIDIHSQHENLLIANDNYQLQVVDSVSKNSDLVENYTTAYNRWCSAKNSLHKLEREIKKQKEDEEFTLFQYNQLSEAKLTKGEQEELQEEQKTLSHIEEIKSELERADQLMSGEEISTNQQLKSVVTALQRIAEYLPEAEEWAERTESCLIELKDIAESLSDKHSTLEYSPERLEKVDNRLTTIYQLQSKFKVATVEELIEIESRLKEKLNKIENSDEELNSLRMEVENAMKELSAKAKLLTDSRVKNIPTIEKYIVKTLQELGMPNVKFVAELTETTDYTSSGNNRVTFLFSANKNRTPQPVAEIASGGEIARFMLALKSMLVSKTELPTIIFDEIDTGVSGEIAEKMGEIMSTMSSGTQVFSITHLPQIAAKGSQHFKVYKDSSGEESVTKIKKLSHDERIQEIAQMLSGKSVTEAALKNAKELIIPQK